MVKNSPNNARLSSYGVFGDEQMKVWDRVGNVPTHHRNERQSIIRLTYGSLIVDVENPSIVLDDACLSKHTPEYVHEALPVLVGTGEREIGAKIGFVYLVLLVPLAFRKNNEMVGIAVLSRGSRPLLEIAINNDEPGHPTA